MKIGGDVGWHWAVEGIKTSIGGTSENTGEPTLLGGPRLTSDGGETGVNRSAGKAHSWHHGSSSRWKRRGTRRW